MQSRGERNNNPGNLEASAWTRRQRGYIGSDGRFARFDTMANGIAAQASLLGSYIRRGYDSITEIIWRYGNDPGPQDDVSVRNYINYVARRLGISPTERLSQSQTNALAQAMREFETGNTARGVIGSGSGQVGNTDGWNNIGGALSDAVVDGLGTVLDPFGVTRGTLGIGNSENSITGYLSRLFAPNLWSRATAIFIGIVLITVALVAFIISNRTEIISNAKA
jgi:hypothetical protein